MPKRRPDESLPPVQFSEVMGLDEVMQPRQPGRSRMIVAGLVGLVLIVIAVGLIQRRLPFLNYSAATVTTSRTNNTGISRNIILQTNINYGLFLNDKPLQAPSGAPFQLPADVNKMALQAPPFQPLECTISWPPDQGSVNCQSSGTTSDENLAGTVYYINFLVSTDDLSSDQRKQVDTVTLGTIQTAAAAIQLDVPAGDYYPYAYATNGLPLSRRATAPLTAALNVDGLAPNSCGETICPDTNSTSINVNYQMPTISFSINPHYLFTFTEGSAALSTFDLTPPQQLTSGIGQPVTLGLSYDTAQGWQAVAPLGEHVITNVQDQSYTAICYLGANAITQALNTAGTTDTGFGFPHIGAQGCQIDLYGPADPNTPIGSFIDRFGAVLAANAGAHKLLPSLPLAPQDEILAAETGD